GAAGPRGAGGAAGRGPQDGERGAERGLRRGGDGGGHAHLPRQQPHGPGTGEESARGGREADEAGAAALSRRRAPLAHPARALRVRGAAAQMLAMRGGALVRLRTQDPAARRAHIMAAASNEAGMEDKELKEMLDVHTQSIQGLVENQ